MADNKVLRIAIAQELPTLKVDQPTQKDIEEGTYFALCDKHGYYWAEDGCLACWDEAEGKAA